jgi:ABC-type transport system substrate-binding protein
MRLHAVNECAAGATLAFVAFILIFTSVPIHPAVAASSSQLFSMTLLAPTSNPVRRQYASIITNSFQQAGIGVNLVYVAFSVLDAHLFPSSCPCGQSYANGGFDGAFIGWGGGAPVPDFRLTTHFHTETPPPTGNFANFSNATLDALIDQYQHSTDAAQRTSLGQQIIGIFAQERVYDVVYYPADIFAFRNYVTTWGQPTGSTKYTETNVADFEHWTLTSGNTANVAVTGSLNDFNPLPSSTSNSIYNLWAYGSSQVALQQFDPRSGAYINALASNIAVSSDGLSYTISFHPTTWHDGAPVTADDFVFFYQSSLRGEGVSVNEGGFQSDLGLYSQFTYLNSSSHYDLNGTYFETQPTSISATLPQTPTSVFTAINSTAFSFTLPQAYVFANPVLTGVEPLPIHILGAVPESTWDSSTVMTGQTQTPTTVTWDKSKFGGNGSFAYFYGVMGAGPYVYKGYNPVSQVVTLVKNPNYYNASGLASKGWFGVQTVHVDSIVEKTGALAAFANGQVNAMDTNYQFNPADEAQIGSSGGYYAKTVSASAGFQEMGLNYNNPIFGTGTGTPNGQTDPTNAERYARDVRTALSMLIPRDFIIQNLLQGSAVAGITEMPLTYVSLYPAGLAEDPYSPSMAAQYLAKAGYGSYTPPAPPPPTPPPPVTPITAGNISVTAPSFLLGSSINFAGTFSVDPVLGFNSQGFAVVLEQSTDGTHWPALQNGALINGSALLWTTTSTGGYYSFAYTPPTTGTFYYRVWFTGLPVTAVNRNAVNNATVLYKLAQAGGGNQQVTPSQFTAAAKYDVGSLSDSLKGLASSISSAMAGLASSTTSGLNTVQTNLANEISTSVTPLTNSYTSLQSSLNTANANIASLTTTVNNLNSQVSTLTYVAYAAIAVAIILGLVAIFMARRKPSS